MTSELKATGAALPMAAAMAERLLTGEALALADVELPILAGAAGVGVADDPLVVGGVLGVAVPPTGPLAPLMFLVASFTSWNFSINCKKRVQSSTG